ncbi:unnamed protein product [Pleuronectes platessa]|uniref:Uncharacterized protein n=1 Tax=Pleuronectes platessa TaxID=8262 RepID=A0A9N7UL84_PLEPL|nr:unnamed protein product [Pleuronectes platessa]
MLLTHQEECNLLSIELVQKLLKVQHRRGGVGGRLRTAYVTALKARSSRSPRTARAHRQKARHHGNQTAASALERFTQDSDRNFHRIRARSPQRLIAIKFVNKCRQTGQTG